MILKLRDEATSVWKKVAADIGTTSRTLTQTVKSDWLTLGVTIGGTAFTVHKLMDMADEGAKIEQARQVFEQNVTRMGEDATTVFADIKEKSGGLIDDQKIIESTNRALALNVPLDEIGNLMLLSRDRARAMGISTADAFNQITEGVGRGSVRMLKLAGIQIDLTKGGKDASASLAALTGEVAGQGTQMEILTQIHQKYIDKLDLANLAMLTNEEKIQAVKAATNDLKDVFSIAAEKVEIVAMGVETAMAGAFVEAVRGLVGIAEVGEIALNKLGISGSTSVQDFAKELDATVNDLEKKTFDAFAAAGAGADVLSGKAKNLKNDLSGVDQVLSHLSGDKSNLAAIEANITAIEAKVKELGKSAPPRLFTELAHEKDDLKELLATVDGARQHIKEMQKATDELDPSTLKWIEDTARIINAQKDLDKTLAASREQAEQLAASHRLLSEHLLTVDEATGKLQASFRGFTLNDIDAQIHSLNEELLKTPLLSPQWNELNLKIQETQAWADRLRESMKTPVVVGVEIEYPKDTIEGLEQELHKLEEQRKVIAFDVDPEDFARINANIDQVQGTIDRLTKNSSKEFKDLWKSFEDETGKAAGKALSTLLGFDNTRAANDLEGMKRRNELANIEDQKTRLSLAKQLHDGEISRKEYDLRLQDLTANRIQREEDLNKAYADNTKSTLDELSDVWKKFWDDVVSAALEKLATLAVTDIFALVFHEGGQVPGGSIGGLDIAGGSGGIPTAHEGQYIAGSPSSEFPILVRGGETIRTEHQEARVQEVIRSEKLLRESLRDHPEVLRDVPVARAMFDLDLDLPALPDLEPTSGPAAPEAHAGAGVGSPPAGVTAAISKSSSTTSKSETLENFVSHVLQSRKLIDRLQTQSEKSSVLESLKMIESTIGIDSSAPVSMADHPAIEMPRAHEGAAVGDTGSPAAQLTGLAPAPTPGGDTRSSEFINKIEKSASLIEKLIAPDAENPAIAGSAPSERSSPSSAPTVQSGPAIPIASRSSGAISSLIKEFERSVALIDRAKTASERTELANDLKTIESVIVPHAIPPESQPVIPESIMLHAHDGAAVGDMGSRGPAPVHAQPTMREIASSSLIREIESNVSLIENLIAAEAENPAVAGSEPRGAGRSSPAIIRTEQSVSAIPIIMRSSGAISSLIKEFDRSAALIDRAKTDSKRTEVVNDLKTIESAIGLQAILPAPQSSVPKSMMPHAHDGAIVGDMGQRGDAPARPIHARPIMRETASSNLIREIESNISLIEKLIAPEAENPAIAGSEAAPIHRSAPGRSSIPASPMAGTPPIVLSYLIKEVDHVESLLKLLEKEKIISLAGPPELPKAHDGTYIDAPASKEFPILVRGGETVRTESQESSIQQILANYYTIEREMRSHPDLLKTIASQGLEILSRADQLPTLAIARDAESIISNLREFHDGGIVDNEGRPIDLGIDPSVFGPLPSFPTAVSAQSIPSSRGQTVVNNNNQVHNLYLTINFKGAVTPDNVKTAVEQGMRKLGVEDPAAFFKNTRSKPTILP